MEFLVEIDGEVYEISELVKSVSFTDKLNDGCSKLEFSYIDDDLKIENGSIARFRYNNANIFYGRVFKHSRGKDNVIDVTAYDQLRYAKAKDSIVIQKDTITTLTTRMCNYLKFQKGTLTDTKYVLATDIADDKTWLDIVYSGISETLTNIGKWYSLRDEAGKICLRDLNDLKLNLILGDGSLCYDFDYEKSIDDDFYNLIKIYVGSKTTDTTSDDQMVVVKDETSMEKYGPLQYFEVTDKDTNASQAKAKAKILLSLYNHEQETLSLDCLGDTSVRAGSSFYAQISDIELNKRLIVRSVTHKFLPSHTMSLEVSL